jgi:hypothetical protein
MKKFILIVMLLICTFSFLFLSGCGGSHKSENQSWRIRVLSITKSDARIKGADGGYMNPRSGSVFLIIKVKVDSKGSIGSFSCDDVTLFDKDGDVYYATAKNSGQGFVIPKKNILQMSIGEIDEEVEFLFAVPNTIEPVLFRFKGLSPIKISEIKIN